MNTFIFTCGDINGIGPEIVVKTLNRIVKRSNKKFIFICPKNVFLNEIKKIKPTFTFEVTNFTDFSSDFYVSIIDIGNYKRELGAPTKISGQASYKALELPQCQCVSGIAYPPGILAPVIDSCIFHR